MDKEEIRKKLEEYASAYYKFHESSCTAEDLANDKKQMEEIVDYFYGIINRNEWE